MKDVRPFLRTQGQRVPSEELDASASLVLCPPEEGHASNCSIPTRSAAGRSNAERKGDWKVEGILSERAIDVQQSLPRFFD